MQLSSIREVRGEKQAEVLGDSMARDRVLDGLDEFCKPVSNFWVSSLNDIIAVKFSSALFEFTRARMSESVLGCSMQVIL